MARRCPWCLEPLSLGERRASECPRCGRPLVGPEGEPRELELRFDQIEARQRARALEVLQWGVPTVAVLAAMVSLIHIGGVLLAPLVALIHLVTLRLFLVREARRYLGPTRRLFTRWAARFAFLWLGLPGYAAMATPLVGIIVGVATFVVLTGIVHVYTAWSLARESARLPMLAAEKAAMVALAALTLLVTAAVVIGGAVLGWSVMTLIDRLSAG
ncbi:MAG: hypothetical protein MUC56_14825 [Thermoanaerobaculales bacterium]|jgi:hypothetical protein|nr:hypothetical protein [Thermoanaerobaculales bacterium]